MEADAGNIKTRLMSLAVKELLISLTCMLVPVHYENCLKIAYNVVHSEHILLHECFTGNSLRWLVE